jgi:hypothetical protein
MSSSQLPNHDAIGRLALAFLEGERDTDLPRAAALYAFARHARLTVEEAEAVSAVVRCVPPNVRAAA